MSQPLFGLVPAGQPVLTTPTSTPTPTSFLYAIPPSPSQKPFSHIVVFLLPGVALPEGTAAAIYLVTPPPSTPDQQQPDFKFLGGIGPGKESAIFKLSTTSSGGGNVVLGISVEAGESVAARMTEGAGALVPAKQQTTVTTLVLAQRIIKNAFNFLASFSGTTGAGGVEVVPLRAFEEWWKKFEARISSDPGFLERDE
ncbi:hypothetical protein QBC39DRAFT_32379 [Podospora conica]|nr:hypothetical protein QBC39DRAFT_32379 [Schizothecium conicum]